MWKLNTIGRRVLAGNSIIIIVALISCLLSLERLTHSQSMLRHSFSVITPSVEAINDLLLLVTRSKMYITNWIHLPDNIDDKEDLNLLHNEQFPEVKDRISKLKRDWQNKENVYRVDSIIIAFDDIIQTEKEVMNTLNRSEDYNDGNKREKAIRLVNEMIIPNSNTLIKNLEALEASKLQEKQVDGALVESSLSSLYAIILILGVFTIAIGIIASIVSFGIVSKPIQKLNQVLGELAKGSIPSTNFGIRIGKHEIGQMTRSLQELIRSLRNTSEFARKIGSGKYDSAFDVLGENDILGNALLDMRNSLAKVAEEDRRRAWITEGIAQFGDILRANYKDTEEFAAAIIQRLVKYTEANQGGVFIISDTPDNEGEFMYLAAAYAWDKPKYLEKKVRKGEGLTGQAWQEGETLFLSYVPEDYVHITSGLGNTNPSSILLAPLKYNQKLYGVIELAFFNPPEAYRVEFVEKIVENFASTLSSVRTNQRTKLLLRESQEMTEQMRAQEEEMRQNVEELQATQEMVERKSKELENQLNAINQAAAMIELNPRGIITQINTLYLKISQYSQEEIKDQPHTILLKDGYETSNRYMQLWENLTQGIPVEGEFERQAKDKSSFWVRGTYYPVMDNYKNLERVIHIATDITEQKLQAIQLEESLAEQAEAVEQMRMQEEIMQQAMEKMQSVQEEIEKREKQLEEAHQEQQQYIEQMNAQEEMMAISMETMNEAIETIEEEKKELMQKLETCQKQVEALENKK
ncbi:GAF domain-containing protein [Bernardetia sp.]|uniref:GAF domain-containing protein n=1 Tax=Bernardetia sp. TaxID=1937974 RepID=UPI0025C6A742|nr:GAF domain-containing protein [Bernardetia sp.]